MKIREVVKAAKAAGMSATIIVLHQDGDDLVEAPEDGEDIAYAEGALKNGDVLTQHGRVQQLLQERDAARAEVEKLLAEKAEAPPDGAAPWGADPEELTKAKQTIAELECTIETYKADLAKAQACTVPVGAPTDSADEADLPMASFENYPIDVLGLEKKEYKGCQKAGCKTVGDVKVALMEGKLKEAKLPKDSIITVANKLLGAAPSSRAEAPQAAQEVSSTAPAGHEDRSWDARLQAAFKKEERVREFRIVYDQMLGQRKQLEGQAPTPDIGVQLEELEKRMVTQDKMLRMYEGQLSAVLWSMGLPHDISKVKSVDGSLQAAGLAHLMRETPAPEAK